MEHAQNPANYTGLTFTGIPVPIRTQWYLLPRYLPVGRHEQLPANPQPVSASNSSIFRQDIARTINRSGIL